MSALRFLIAAAAATVITLAMLIVGLWASGAFDEEEVTLHEFEQVDLISTTESIDVAELLAEREKERVRREAPPPPQPIMPERTVSGFVQVQFTVEPDGTVSDVRVVGAVPKGYYEEQAKAEIAGKRFMPQFDGDQAVASTRSEIVDFTVPADAAARAEELTPDDG